MSRSLVIRSPAGAVGLSRTSGSAPETMPRSHLLDLRWLTTRGACRREGRKARSVRAAFQLYQQAVDVGLVELAPRTRVTVRSAANTMSSTTLADGRPFGDIRLSRLTWQDIEALYGVNAGGRPWRRHGFDGARRFSNRALELARKRGLLDTNPSKDAARPRLTRTKPFAPSAEEVRELLGRVRHVDPELADAMTVLASTGMRLGELLGLWWKDLSFLAAEVQVGVGDHRRWAGCSSHTQADEEGRLAGRAVD